MKFRWLSVVRFHILCGRGSSVVPERFMPIWNMLGGEIPSSSTPLISELNPQGIRFYQEDGYTVLFKAIEDAQSHAEYNLAMDIAIEWYVILCGTYTPELVRELVRPVIDAIEEIIAGV